MPPAYTLLPSSNGGEGEKGRKRRWFGLVLNIPLNSRVKLYILAVLAGVLLQLSLLLAYPRVFGRTACLEVDELQNAGDEGEEWSLNRARKMVSHTKGYYARDYSLNLGWNNVRYIIEASVYQAKLLNRTLVLPSFVYARSCKYDVNVCAAFLPKAHWTEAAHRFEWSDHPFEQEYIFRVPLEDVLDLRRLRAGPTQDQWTSEHSGLVKWPVITVAEYLQLHGLDPQIEQHNGYWGRVDYQLPPGTNVTAYHESLAAKRKGSEEGNEHVPRTVSGLRRAIEAVHIHAKRTRDEGSGSTVHEMLNEEWDTAPLVRVDDVRALRGYDPRSWKWTNRSLTLSGTGAQGNEMSRKLFLKLNETLSENNQVVMEVEQVRQLAQAVGYQALKSPSMLEKVMNRAGWDFVYTFQGRLNQEFIKAIVWPMTQVAPRMRMRGFVNDLAQRTENVVIVSGEIHLERKAGLMRFTSSAARDAYSQIGLYAM
ncbi:hypothetical protein FRC12_021676, partial [Ceratobasidium sp. 428]